MAAASPTESEVVSATDDAVVVVVSAVVEAGGVGADVTAADGSDEEG